MRSKRPVSDYDSDEMEECSDAYVQFVMEQYEAAKQVCNDPVVLIEQRLDFSCYVPDGFSTGDCVIISDDKLHIIDFKYGMGVLVESEDNLKMKLYALGALATVNLLGRRLSVKRSNRNRIGEWYRLIIGLYILNTSLVYANYSANFSPTFCETR